MDELGLGARETFLQQIMPERVKQLGIRTFGVVRDPLDRFVRIRHQGSQRPTGRLALAHRTLSIKAMSETWKHS